MINMSFWKLIKEKWIRDEDPTIEATKEFIQSDGRSSEEINELNQKLNGNYLGSNEQGSLDGLNSMMEQLNELGVDGAPFDDLFLNITDEE